MTEMGCDKDRMSQDDWLIALLGSKPAVRLSGDELTLESGPVVVRLLDRRVVEPDVALAGHAWTVVSIMNGDTVSSVPAGATATVTFNADGTLTLNAGCNQGGGDLAGGRQRHRGLRAGPDEEGLRGRGRPARVRGRRRAWRRHDRGDDRG